MNTSKLKTYAPDARRDFIAAVTRRAAKFGLTAKGVSPIREEGQLVFIEGQPYPKSVGAQRAKLADRIAQQGFQQVMEAAAYTWFNRLAAIRFMELHGYLDHSFRVLSHPAGGALPEILEQAQHVDLPGLDRQRVIELKMDGTRDEELYRDLLLAQCHALHQAMPFLFERVDDETELLLPDNLLQTDSLIRELVTATPEEDWQEIEIIGWLYQFYISEKKDQVIGKVVKSEDIPAATQLFTPNWIVKYMVQNSLGAQWLATYPDSPLKGQMEYYIEPAEQTEEVKAQLKAITPSTLNPEELTLIDPACGSGHILVEAYELFKAIYLERGYRPRDVAKLILEKNLFGLDIDGRAAQLTGFALMMKGRADDRRLFERGVKLNVMAFVDSAGFDAERLAEGATLAEYGLQPGHLTELKRLFERATTFGSLIQVPDGLAAKLPTLKWLSASTSQDLFVSDALKRLGPLVRQAEMLAAKYDAVVANPPYMGNGGMTGLMKKFTKEHYPRAKRDLFACFFERECSLATSAGRIGVLAPYVWMFIDSYEQLRTKLLSETLVTSLIQLEYNAFEPACVPVAAFLLMRRHVKNFAGKYIQLGDFKGHQSQAPKTLEAIGNPDCGWLYRASQDDFKKITGSPLAYWVGRSTREAFSQMGSLGELATTRKGMVTANNDLYLRHWFEIDERRLGLRMTDRENAKKSGRKWFPYFKGGGFRRWYGNRSQVVNWENDGADLRTTRHPTEDRVWATNFNLDHIFSPNINWSELTSGQFSARLSYGEGLFDSTGCACFPDEHWRLKALAFMNTKIADSFLGLLNPTLHYPPGSISALPFPPVELNRGADSLISRIVELATLDWDAYDRSWDFQSLPILTASTDPTPTLESSYTAWTIQNRETIAEMKRLEEGNNRIFIDAYGLADELTPEVPIEQITLTVNPAYRYGGKLTEEEQWTRFRQDTMQELVSYAIGCAMGRYSLDEPGLIYAHSGNVGFDPSRYSIFPPDADGIVPITDTDWFDDDATHRIVEFISVAWDKAHLEENLKFLANNLSRKKDESSRETIRRYLCDSFFKDHLQTYKKRPIYWCFTSGKQKAFQCLVYLHRYNEGTLARMRMEYVVPLQSKMAARIDKLGDDIQAASTGAQAKRLQKERDKLTKQLEELRRFDEQLRHCADQRIALDLDDGVKVNYGKFGDLLAEVKAVTGGRSGE
ncbi:MAG: BREX-1 system adenine-specific DNA-methyltransferase PglX [Chromatiaceae bacterium]